MDVNVDYLETLDKVVTNSRVNSLKEVLLHGRELRLESGKSTPFWDIEQRQLHAKFDALYTRGVERLSREAPSKLPALIERVTPRIPFQGIASMAAKIGLGGLAGFLVGSVYNNSKSNLIIHEYGHAWAAHAIWSNVQTRVSTLAQYWIKVGDFWKWFDGVREGAPGNYTSFRFPNGPPHITHFGEHLTAAERSLFISSAGLGAELVLNSTVAGLGLLAIRRKQRVLGVSLIAMTLAPFSGGHSYIRRWPGLLHKWDPPPNGDPARIAKLMGEVFNISNVDAYRILWYGYIFLPILLLGLMAIALFKPVSEVPKECVLMRMLADGKDQPALQKILTEVELENAEKCQAMAKMNQEEKEKLIVTLSDSLLSKIKAEPETRALFKETHNTLEKELKKDQPLNFTMKMKSVAALVSLVAFQIRSLDLVAAMAPVFFILTGVFLFAQSLSVLLDGVQTISDLANEKLNTRIKALSVAKTALSAVSLAGITAVLFVSSLVPFAVPFFIALVVAQVSILALRHLENRRLATEASVAQ
ncbi:MAG: hypothetical protein P0S96_05680 [Simkaniaceae bacterium]|nr:hypothetical protein [Candidatus Sacchlamyda saccharinae]